MPEAPLSNSGILAAYREKTPTSAKLFEEACRTFPSGITHDSRRIEPYGIYVERAQGPRKWDVDGNEYIDYFGGHGALLLGHNDPDVGAAISDALACGTHFGASHAGELRWAQKIQDLVPSAEKVRFTSSGTEATLLALRLARTATGRTKIMRVRTHFHGWHDHMASGQNSHFDGSSAIGLVPGIAESTVLVDPEDLDGARAALAAGDIAAAILEPTGSSTGMVPTSPAFLEGLREATAENGTALIFDEVVTGFRVSPGGAQGHYGIRPDLTAFAKIVSGGVPGGALAGRADFFERLDFDITREKGIEKVGHQGTYNANPVAAAAGLAALTKLEATGACERANATGERLRAGLNDAIRAAGVPWAAYGTFSVFHIFTNPAGRADVSPDSFDPFACGYEELRGNAPGAAHKLRLAMNVNGVDLTGWPGGTISATHGEAEIDATVAAFARSLDMLKADGEL